MILLYSTSGKVLQKPRDVVNPSSIDYHESALDQVRRSVIGTKTQDAQAAVNRFGRVAGVVTSRANDPSKLQAWKDEPCDVFLVFELSLSIAVESPWVKNVNSTKCSCIFLSW